MTNQNVGTIVTVIGAVLDIKFHPDHLPNLLNAIEIDNNGQKLVVEVAQHIGDDIVRCIAMGSTDGLVRGMEAVLDNLPGGTRLRLCRRGSARPDGILP